MDGTQNILSHVNVIKFEVEEILCNPDGKCLGTGGFGKVVTGFHRVRGRKAIKVQSLLGSQLEVLASKNQFMNELNMMLLVSHANVVRVEGMLEWEDWIGYVMEHMDGGSLHDLLHNKDVARIAPNLLLRMCKEMSDAITYLHKLFKDKRIAHGDLKPQNVLLNSDLHCKISDFGGAAIASHSLHGSHGRDATGQGKQTTLLFAAPERLGSDSKRLSTAMDVYSFAVIIYFVLTRQYPSFVKDREILRVKILQGLKMHFDFSKIEQLKEEQRRRGNNENVQIITLLEEIMMQCLDKDPSNRVSMIEVRDRLRELLEKVDQTYLSQNVTYILNILDIKPVKEEQSIPINQVFGRGMGGRPTLIQPRGEVMDQTRNVSILRENQPANQSQVEASSGTIHQIREDVDIINNNIATIVGKFTLHCNDDDVKLACDALIASVDSVSVATYGFYKIICDVIDVSVRSREEKYFMTSLDLLKCAKVSSEKINQSQSSIELHRSCAQQAGLIALGVQDVYNPTSAIIDQLQAFLEDILGFISSVHADDEKVKVKAKAECWKSLGICYSVADNDRLTIESNIKAMSALEEAFGEDCTKHRVYGVSCNNLGASYSKLDRTEEAENLFMKAHTTNTQAHDFSSEEFKLSIVEGTINNLAGLYENHPKVKGKNTRKIYQYLKQRNLTGLSRFTNQLMSLRFAILLNEEDDVKKLCEEVVAMTSVASPPPHQCMSLVINIIHMSKALFKVKNYKAAISSLQAASMLSSRIVDSNRKLEIMHFLYAAITFPVIESIGEYFMSLLLQNVIPLGEEIIQKIAQSSNVDEQSRLKYQSLCLNNLSYCYLHATKYQRSCEKAQEAINLLSSDLGVDQDSRNSYEAGCYFIMGFCQHRLRNYGLTEESYTKAIDLWKDQPDMEENVKIARKNLELTRKELRGVERMRF